MPYLRPGMVRQRRARLGYIPSPTGPEGHPVRVWVEAGEVVFRPQYASVPSARVKLSEIYAGLIAREYLPGCAPQDTAAQTKNSLPPVPLGRAKARGEGVGESDGASRAGKISARKERAKNKQTKKAKKQTK